MKFIKTDNKSIIENLRVKLYKTLTEPIDVMWEQLYIASSQDYLIESNNKTIGYCCINNDACLNQIYLEKESLAIMKSVIEELISTKLIKSASLSSSQAIAFNTCLLLSTSTKANTLCYKHVNTVIDKFFEYKLEMATPDDIPFIKQHYKEQIQMDDNAAYIENIVARKELFIVRKSGKLVATSECRISDTQDKIADLGIIVNKNHHCKGIATQVTQIHVNRLLKMGKRPICSTTYENIASQKVLEKVGFYCSNIIFDMKF